MPLGAGRRAARLARPAGTVACALLVAACGSPSRMQTLATADGRLAFELHGTDLEALHAIAAQRCRGPWQTLREAQQGAWSAPARGADDAAPAHDAGWRARLGQWWDGSLAWVDRSTQRVNAAPAQAQLVARCDVAPAFADTRAVTAPGSTAKPPQKPTPVAASTPQATATVAATTTTPTPSQPTPGGTTPSPSESTPPLRAPVLEVDIAGPDPRNIPYGF